MKWLKALLPVFLVGTMVLAGCSKNLVGSDSAADDKIFKIIDVNLTEENYGIGVDKDKPELLEQLNDFIEQVENDGTMDEIVGRYMSGQGVKRVTTADVNSSRDQLVVATTLDFEPFEYGDSENYYGIDLELIKAFADHVDKDLVLIISSFNSMFLSVSQHKCDMCIGGISITEERAQYVDFSIPYYTTAQAIIVTEDNTEFDECKKAEDVETILRTKTKDSVIGVENLTTALDYCEGNDYYEGFPCTVTGYRDLSSALLALSNGECNYVVADYMSAKYLIDDIGGDND